MRRFQFRLESVREWRVVQLELEEARLERLLAEHAGLEAALAGIETERAESQRAVLGAHEVDAQQLAALEAHRRHLAREQQRLSRERAACEQRIAAQRERVATAGRHLRLLEKLKARRFEEWRAQTDAEQEALAAELFLAQWHRSPR